MILRWNLLNGVATILKSTSVVKHINFFPIVKTESIHNAYWLMLILVAFYMSATAYIIPYNALLPEVTDTADEKVKLSSFQQVGFVIGIILSAFVNNFADR